MNEPLRHNATLRVGDRDLIAAITHVCLDRPMTWDISLVPRMIAERCVAEGLKLGEAATLIPREGLRAGESIPVRVTRHGGAPRPMVYVCVTVVEIETAPTT